MYTWNNIQDIFILPQGPNDAVVITTNGIVKSDGFAVMGKGIALEADTRFELSQHLGKYLTQYGNRAFYLGVKTDNRTNRQMAIITFPTKHDWRQPSDINLIQTSAQQLVSICDKFNIRTCYLPQPGCTNGGLDFSTQVKPVLEPILDNRFIVTDYK